MTKCNCCGIKRPYHVVVLYTDTGFTICEKCIEVAVDRLNDIRLNGMPAKPPPLPSL